MPRKKQTNIEEVIEKIFDYTSIWLDYLRGGRTQIVNTNKLLRTYDGITGLKTGTTGDAGSCITCDNVLKAVKKTPQDRGNRPGDGKQPGGIRIEKTSAEK